MIQKEESDSGFGLVEVIVSLFLLVTLSVLIAAGLMQSVLASQRNATVATASQLITEEVARIHASVSTCEALLYLTNPSAIAGSTTTAADGTILQTKVTSTDWVGCDESVQDTYPIRVSVLLGETEVLWVHSVVVIR